ncbi:MAG: hypothetical protein HRU12_09780 [Phaeodactylibacter sp.]|nr:hypothetical protein [Phaeodactylibacter sp.]
MFFVKFLENIFSNSLKDKPGPSFAYIYIFAWLMMNYLYPFAFLSTKGEISSKFLAIIAVKKSIVWWEPAGWAFLIIILKPWLNNLGLLARETSDKATQKVLRALNIKKYRTEEEFELVTSELESTKSQGRDLKTTIDQLTISKEELKTSHEIKVDQFTTEKEKLETNHKVKIDQFTTEKEKLETNHKIQINQFTTKKEELETNHKIQIDQFTAEKEKLVVKLQTIGNKLTHEKLLLGEGQNSQITQLLVDKKEFIETIKNSSDKYDYLKNKYELKFLQLNNENSELEKSLEKESHKLTKINSEMEFYKTKNVQISNLNHEINKQLVNGTNFYNREEFGVLIKHILNHYRDSSSKLILVNRLVSFLNWEPKLPLKTKKLIVRTFLNHNTKSDYLIYREELFNILYNDKNNLDITTFEKLNNFQSFNYMYEKGLNERAALMIIKNESFSQNKQD